MDMGKRFMFRDIISIIFRPYFLLRFLNSLECFFITSNISHRPHVVQTKPSLEATTILTGGLIVGVNPCRRVAIGFEFGGSAVILNVLQITQDMVKVVPDPDIQVPEIGYKDGNIRPGCFKINGFDAAVYYTGHSTGVSGGLSV